VADTTEQGLGSCTVGVATEQPGSPQGFDDAYTDRSALQRLIAASLRQAGLGRASREAPLRDIIAPGMTVLLKPNWVHDRNAGPDGMTCMVTHPNFILAALEEVLKARPRRVVLGDSPIQGCHWDALVTPDFQEMVKDLGASQQVPVDIVDFRAQVVTDISRKDGIHVRSERSGGQQVHFDLKSDSLLEPISTPHGRFRGICYSPEALAQTHVPGRHEYALCREAFDADVVLGLPKLKTHRRAGLTAALKNLVGICGDKDLLPHHRLGSLASGGDCYARGSLVKRLGEYCYDMSNRNIGSLLFKFWGYGYAAARRLATRPEDGHLEAAWHGNDTTWRMALDLNRILLYGHPDGTMSDVPQRKLYSLTDAIVCGESEGPLHPRPVRVGVVTFSDCAPAADAIHAALLRFDYRRIPLIREAFGQFRWPLLGPDAGLPVAHWNERSLTVEEVSHELGVKADPPAGWAGHLEWTPSHSNCGEAAVQ